MPLLTKAHPALRDGAHQDRYSSDEAGIYAFSRLHREQQREYVVALNNSESEKTAAIPTYVRNGNFVKVYGSGPAAAHLQRQPPADRHRAGALDCGLRIRAADPAIRCSAADLP